MNDRPISDEEIRAAFQARAEGSPSADLAERIRATTQQTRQQRRLALLPGGLPRNTQRLLWAAAVSATSLALVGGLLLAGRQNDDRTSVLPSATPTASSEPSPNASAEPSGSPMPTPHEAAFSVDAFVQVAVPGGIPIRLQPDPDSETMFPYTFGSGTPLLVAEGPVSTGDIEWYYLVPAYNSADLPGGWAPATDGATPVLVPAIVECPTSPLASAQLVALFQFAVLGCFGSGEITVVGAVSCVAETASPGENAPSWSRPDRRCVLVSAPKPYPVFGDPIFDMVPADAALGVAVDGRYELTGHFNDERCLPGDGVVTDDARLDIVHCRAWFIVTGIRPVGIAVDTSVVTISDNLRVRSAPGVGVSSAKLEPLLGNGARLFVIAGPVTADGYDWYQVKPFDSGYPSGWVAWADRDGTPWLESDTQLCPTSPLNAQAMNTLTPLGALACYGDDEIELIGEVHCEFADVDLLIAGPDWLHYDRYCTFNLGDGGLMPINDGGMTLGYPMTWQAIVTGHFDDPQAATCTYGGESPAPDPASVVFDCRAMFVGTSIDGVP